MQSLSWSQWTSLISGSVASLLNLFLLPIIVFFSTEKIGSYKYLLLMYTMSAASMSICQVNTLAALAAPENGYIFYSTITIYPVSAQHVLVFGYASSLTINLVVICWCFAVRLSVVLGSNILRELSRKTKFFAWLSVFVCIFLVGNIYLIRGTDETVQLLSQTIWNISAVNLSEVGFYGATIMRDGRLNWRLASALIFSTIFMVFVTIFVVICWWKIRNRLQNLRSLQIRVYKNQYRLYLLLTFQALLPLMFNTTPTCVAFIAGLTGFDMGIVLTICGSTLSFAQVMDPILTFILISEYRVGLFRILGMKTSRVYDATLTSGIYSLAKA